ncbi:hypothetical protein AB0J82_06175 [Asanoa sp. NPDC049518]|uniref:hypothetical protein n=1 Tax=unclassified Asanoa TaxID=2685164 RepID=UPI003434836E
MTTIDVNLTSLRVERRDLLAAHRQLLDYGIASQTAEVRERVADIDGQLTESADYQTSAPQSPLLDPRGYLACGCHGTQRDHTCMPFDTFNPEEEL